MDEESYQGVFVLGMMHPEDRSYTSILDSLASRFGSILHSGEPYEFDHTDYYADEMGESLVRHWQVFADLVPLAEIVERKRTTMRLEEQLGLGGLGEGIDPDRWLNLDPGYVTGAKFVLASRKNHSHRIYLRQGVFAELTLRYQNGEWTTLPWTFPDLQNPEQHPWLDRARSHWLEET